MSQTALVKFTALDSPQIDNAISRVIKHSSRVHIHVVGLPRREKVVWPKRRAQLAGCEGIDLHRKVITVSGETEDLKKILRLKIPEDVYIELSL